MLFPYQPMEPMAFGAVGECIYCGTADNLTDEHVIPFAMGGRWTLPQSSCTSCAAETSLFEGRLLRSGAWWPLRRALDLASRRPKKQPDSFPATASTPQGPRAITVPLGDHPLVIPILRFDPPTALSGRPLPGCGDRGIVGTGIAVLPLRPLAGLGGGELRWSAQTPKHEVTYPVELDANDLGRLVAKVGWGFAVARHGVSAFSEIYVRELILGDTTGGNRWIGELTVTPVKASRELHAVGEIDRAGLLSVWSQFFSPAPAAASGGAWPTYQAVVGRLSREA